ncbi:MAG: hypothetical protein IKJ81_00140, partial [Bacteroidales bacterium]|nr:hypothetical protein [Bacteroidales bacterium]
MKPIRPINPINPINPILLSFLLLLSLSAAAKPKSYTLASPDGRLVTHITADWEGMSYDLVYDGKPLMSPSRSALYCSSPKRAVYGTMSVK